MSYQNFNLEGKVGVVIGGTSGIGRAIAAGLADAGADIVPVSRSPEKVRDAVKEIESKGRRSLAVPTDATLREDMERLADTVLDEFNHVDILVNSAGTIRVGPFLELTDEDFDVVMNTNLRAVVPGHWKNNDETGKGKDHKYIISFRVLGTAGYSSLQYK